MVWARVGLGRKVAGVGGMSSGLIGVSRRIWALYALEAAGAVTCLMPNFIRLGTNLSVAAGLDSGSESRLFGDLNFNWEADAPSSVSTLSVENREIYLPECLIFCLFTANEIAQRKSTICMFKAQARHCSNKSVA